MDSIVQTIIAIATAMGGAISFMEMRMQRMYQQIQEKIADKNEVNKVIQEQLRQDMARLEAKIDMILQNQFNSKHSKDNHG